MVGRGAVGASETGDRSISTVDGGKQPVIHASEQKQSPVGTRRNKNESSMNVSEKGGIVSSYPPSLGLPNRLEARKRIVRCDDSGGVRSDVDGWWRLGLDMIVHFDGDFT